MKSLKKLSLSTPTASNSGMFPANAGAAAKAMATTSNITFLII
jgi:hypothetical protein